MNTVTGYAMSGWDTGYGDMVMKPDLTTLRRIPWLPGTALVLADLAVARRQPHRARAAPRPAPPAGPITRARAARLRRHRAGIHGLRRHLPPGLGQRLSRLDSGQRLQLGLRGDGLQPHGAAAARHPAAHAGRGSALGGRQGGVQQGSAGARASPTTRRWSRATTTASTKTAPKRSPTSTASR